MAKAKNFTEQEAEQLRETVLEALATTSRLGDLAQVAYTQAVEEADITTLRGLDTLMYCMNGTIEKQSEKLCRSIKMHDAKYKEASKKSGERKKEQGANFSLSGDCDTALRVSVLGTPFKVWTNPETGENLYRPLRESEDRKNSDATNTLYGEVNKAVEKYLYAIGLKNWNMEEKLDFLHDRLIMRVRKAFKLK